MLKVYGYPNTRSTRVVWALEEAGLEYQYALVDLRKGAGRQPSYTDVNPGGKVPTLIDGDLTLTESAAICNYIADQYAAGKLAPAAGGKQRACYDQWCYFTMTELEQPLWTIAKHSFALPEKVRVPQIIETAKWEFAGACKVLARGLQDSEYIIGDTFSMADLLLAHTLAWARMAKLPLDFQTLERYTDRLLSRPALLKATARERSASVT